jgi:DNA-binding transcriptional LysR family regulator
MVATSGGFTAASGRLGMTPSAVSQKIRQLESHLGVRLFERTSRSVRLTEAGQMLLDGTERPFSDLGDALDHVRTAGKEPAGDLRINLSHLAAQVCILPRLAGFVRRYPDITLELISDDRLADIVAGGYHAGIRVFDSLEMDMIAKPIGPPMRRTVMASSAYLEEMGTPRHPGDLIAHRVIRYRFPGSQRLQPLIFNMNGRALQVSPAPSMVLNDNDHIVLAVREGLGLAQRFHAAGSSGVAAGPVVELLTDFEPPVSQFHLYYPSRGQPPKLQAFIDWFCR